MSRTGLSGSTTEAAASLEITVAGIVTDRESGGLGETSAGGTIVEVCDEASTESI